MRLISILALLSIGSTAFAADYASTYKSAKDDFFRRGDAIELAQSCANKAGVAVDLASNDTELYEALVLQSRCTYFIGIKAKSDDDKIRIHALGKSYAERARNIKSLQATRAEAYYFYGINLGRWALANGVMKSLGERHNLRRTMETVIDKNHFAIDDTGRTVPGREYDSWGANRTLGHMYFKLPGMFGGDNRKAESLLRQATDMTPKEARNSLTAYYLAEVLVANGKKAEARQVLDEVIQYENNPEQYNPSRVPESLDEIQDCKTLRSELGN